MKVSLKELELKRVKAEVEKNPVETSFEKWAQPGHFSRTLTEGPKTTTYMQMRMTSTVKLIPWKTFQEKFLVRTLASCH